ncbi:MAG TPA: 2-phospho-L-lactate guanylyltransferase [Sphingobium sp.]|uniref:2-phospho-L-lactate guanylyltransferase n=1 Tax=Sphingobium sp. TaxID=1912891 RepID=UPI002ED1424A
MTRWTAIIPFNFGRPRKTRLSAILSAEERDALALAMAEHVVRTLGAAPSIRAIRLLSPVNPMLPGTIWVEDRGLGLNGELAAARDNLAGDPALLIHADLPLLTGEDVEALLSAASAHGTAIAPDLAGMGTNALALADGRPVTLAFGEDSFARHRATLPGAPLVERPGLALDVDDAASLRAAMASGFALPFPAEHLATGGIATSI